MSDPQSRIRLSAAPPLPVWRKIAYGAGDSGFSLTSTALALLYLFFLVNVVGLDPAAAGIALGIGRIWDALNDLLIGTLSDRARSRWGRRRPYLLFGADGGGGADRSIGEHERGRRERRDTRAGPPLPATRLAPRREVEARC